MELNMAGERSLRIGRQFRERGLLAGKMLEELRRQSPQTARVDTQRAAEPFQAL
jgi:hypothetical protein